ncbi:MAG: A/G-specific adenine glycosylase [Chthoniobacterales bacterium]
MRSADFRRRLLRWYRTNGRDLPWRHTTDPYAILVSEVMLQQTQVATVIPYYERWLNRFRTFKCLAAAPEDEVLHAWQGLGYYSRARNLHSAAKIVVSQYDGILPANPEKIRELPAMGRYSSNAVATFAFDRSVPIVEANITRLLARLFDMDVPVDTTAGRDRLWAAAEMLVPQKNAGRFNSALMDLGATVCVSGTPKCQRCPVHNLCKAPRPELLPIKKPRPKTIELRECHLFVRQKNQILLEKCSTRWRGMWMLPVVRDGQKTDSRMIHSLVFPFTNHRINLRVFRGTKANQSGPRTTWIGLPQLDTVPIPSPHRRAIAALLD